MTSWIHILNPIVTFWADGMARVLCQGSLIVLLIWSIVKLFPAIHPTIRCWLLRLAYLKLFTAFFWAKPMILLVQYALLEFAEGWLRLPKHSAVKHLLKIGHSVFHGFPTDHLPSTTMKLYFWAWVTGILVTTAVIVWLRRRWESIPVDCRPINNPYLESVYQELGNRFRIKNIPRLWISNQLSTPLLQGVIRPRIIIPITVLTTYAPADLQLILAHELAHFCRKDLYWNWLPAAARFIFFFHPVVWLIQNEWCLLQEVCCDHMALGVTPARQSDYGRILLRASIRPALNYVNPAAFFQGSARARGSKHLLRKRLLALKFIGRWKHRPMLAGALVLALLGAAVVIPWQLAEARSLPVNLSINYPPWSKHFEIAAHVLLPPKEIVGMSLLIDGKPFRTTRVSNNVCYGSAVRKEDGLPQIGPHKVTLQVITKTKKVTEENWVFFEDNMNWSNRYLGEHNYKTVIQIGPFLSVFNRPSQTL